VAPAPSSANRESASGRAVFAGLAARRIFFDAEGRSSRGLKGLSVIIRAESRPSTRSISAALGREHDDGDFGGGRLEPQRLANLKAVHFRQQSHRARSGPAFATRLFSASAPSAAVITA